MRRPENTRLLSIFLLIAGELDLAFDEITDQSRLSADSQLSRLFECEEYFLLCALVSYCLFCATPMRRSYDLLRNTSLEARSKLIAHSVIVCSVTKKIAHGSSWHSMLWNSLLRDLISVWLCAGDWLLLKVRSQMLTDDTLGLDYDQLSRGGRSADSSFRCNRRYDDPRKVFVCAFSSLSSSVQSSW